MTIETVCLLGIVTIFGVTVFLVFPKLGKEIKKAKEGRTQALASNYAKVVDAMNYCIHSAKENNGIIVANEEVMDVMLSLRDTASKMWAEATLESCTNDND